MKKRWVYKVYKNARNAIYKNATNTIIIKSYINNLQSNAILASNNSAKEKILSSIIKKVKNFIIME